MRASRSLSTSAGESATSAAAIRADVLPTASRAHRQVTTTVPMPATAERDRSAASESPRSVIQPFSTSTYNGGNVSWRTARANRQAVGSPDTRTPLRRGKAEDPQERRSGSDAQRDDRNERHCIKEATNRNLASQTEIRQEPVPSQGSALLDGRRRDWRWAFDRLRRTPPESEVRCSKGRCTLADLVSAGEVR